MFNRRGEPLTATFETGLAPGLYCNVSGGALDGDPRTGGQRRGRR